MSVETFLVCHTCKQMIWIATESMAGFCFFSKQEDCMEKLGDFLSKWHTSHSIELMLEPYDLMYDEEDGPFNPEIHYREIEWRFNK